MEDIHHSVYWQSSSLFIGLPWLIFHYITKWKTAATLTRATRSCSTNSTTLRAGSMTGCARSSGS